MTEAAARAEAVKNSMFPATALMYLMDRRHPPAPAGPRPAAGFELAAFHDRLLSCRSIPVSLAAAALLTDGRAGGVLPDRLPGRETR